MLPTELSTELSIKRKRILSEPVSTDETKKTRVEPSNYLVLIQLDVGQGDSCILIEYEKSEIKKTILLDSGIGKEENIREILDQLKQYHVKTVDMVIVTHYDEDHLGGIKKILKVLKKADQLSKDEEKIKLLFKDSIFIDPGEPFGFDPKTNCSPVGKKAQGQDYINLLEDLGKNEASQRRCKGVTVHGDKSTRLLGQDLFNDKLFDWTKLKNQERICSLVCICQNGSVYDFESMKPDKVIDFSHVNEKKANPKHKNDRGIGFLLFYHGCIIYTAGDINKKMESKIADKLKKVGITAHIMKLSHHGSCGSTPEDLTESLDPEYIFNSHGHQNSHSHPHVDLLKRFIRISETSATSSSSPSRLKEVVFTNPFPESHGKANELKTNLIFKFAGVRHLGDVFPQRKMKGHITTKIENDKKYSITSMRNKKQKYVTQQKSYSREIEINNEKNPIHYDFGDHKMRKLEEFKISFNQGRIQSATGVFEKLEIKGKPKEGTEKLVLHAKIPIDHPLRTICVEEIQDFAAIRSDQFLSPIFKFVDFSEKDATLVLKITPPSVKARKTSLTLNFLLLENLRLGETSWVIDKLNLIHKKSFKPGIALPGNKIRMNCLEFFEFAGVIKEEKNNISFAFSAVVSHSPFITFSIAATDFGLDKIFDLFNQKKAYLTLLKLFGLSKILLKGLFLVVERDPEGKKLFKLIAEFGVRVGITFSGISEVFSALKDCSFDIDIFCLIGEQPAIQCSLMMSSNSKPLNLLELLKGFGVKVDIFEKGPELQNLKISVTLNQNGLRGFSFSFAVVNAFDLKLFGREVKCSWLEGEFNKVGDTFDVQLHIAVSIQDGFSFNLQAGYSEEEGWKISLGSSDLFNLQIILDLMQKLTGQDSTFNFESSPDNYLHFWDLFIELSKGPESSLSFSGSCCSSIGFQIPFTQVFVQALAKFSFPSFHLEIPSLQIYLPFLDVQIEAALNISSDRFEIQKPTVKKFSLAKLYEKTGFGKGLSEEEDLNKEATIQSIVWEKENQKWRAEARIHAEFSGKLLQFGDKFQIELKSSKLKLEITKDEFSEYQFFLCLKACIWISKQSFQIESKFTSTKKGLCCECTLEREHLNQFDLEKFLESLGEDAKDMHELLASKDDNAFELQKIRISINFNKKEAGLSFFTPCLEFEILFYPSTVGWGVKIEVKTFPSNWTDLPIEKFNAIVVTADNQELGHNTKMTGVSATFNLSGSETKELRGMLKNIPNQIDVSFRLKKRHFYYPLKDISFEVPNIIHFEAKEFCISKKNLSLQSKIKFGKIFGDFLLEGEVKANLKKPKFEADLKVSELQIQIFKSLTVTSIGLKGVIYPLEGNLGLSAKGNIKYKSKKGSFEIGVGISGFNLSLNNFPLSLKSLVYLTTGEEACIPEYLDELLKITPRPGTENIQIEFLSPLNFKASFRLEILGKGVNVDIEVGITGINAELYFDKISLFDGRLELLRKDQKNDQKKDQEKDPKLEPMSKEDQNKGPKFILQILPFQLQFLCEFDAKIVIFGSFVECHFRLTPKGFNLYMGGTPIGLFC